MMKQHRQCLVLCSGGVDSVTLAYYLRTLHYSVELVHIDYGQIPAVGERRAIQAISQESGIPIATSLEIPELGCWGSGSLVDQKSGAMTEEFPYRNLLLTTCGAIIAARLSIEAIAIGVIDARYANYNDCRASTLKSMKVAFKATNPNVRLLTPFARNSKRKIVDLAVCLGVPLEYTFSCNRWADRHCWECTGCIERRSAFEECRVPL